VRARSAFWASVTVCVLLVTLALVLLGSAYARNAGDGVPAPTYGDDGVVQLGCSSIFSSCEEFDPTVWYAAGGGLMLAAAVAFVFAARRRTPS
jgi:hypothetical protein